MIPYNPRFTMRLFEVGKYIPVYPAIKLIRVLMRFRGNVLRLMRTKKNNASKKKPTDSWNIPKISQKSTTMKDSLHKQVVFPGSGVCPRGVVGIFFQCLHAGMYSSCRIPCLETYELSALPATKKMLSKLILGVERKPWKSKNSYPKTVFEPSRLCFLKSEEFQWCKIRDYRFNSLSEMQGKA